MEKKIEQAIRRYSMDIVYEGAILGFSGGADSSAILHYLSKRCKNLLCVHINHQIRGEEADRDEDFCKKVCQSYGVPFLSYKIDIPKISKERKKGLEETAREERYRIFYSLLQEKREYKCIVTAHNSDDNAETVLFNLARGTGTNGLMGIKPVINQVYRPLIYCTKKEIIDYCNDNNIEYVTDSTNNEDAYTRNHIRHNILPQLEKINPSFKEACHRLGEIVNRDEEYINHNAKIAYNELVKNGRVNTIGLSQLDYAVGSRVIKMLSPVLLDYKGIESCLELAKDNTTGKMVNLSNGYTFKIEHSYASFIKTAETERVSYNVPLSEGVNSIEAISKIITINCILPEYSEEARVTLSSDFVYGKLYARNKLDGDTILNQNMTKKLKKVFCDKHIPSHLRDKLPVICDDRGVLAIAGVIARDGAYDKKGQITIRVYKEN